MPSDSMLIIYSPYNRAANLSLRALSFYRPRSLQIYANDELAADVAIPTSFYNVTAPIHLANGTNTVRLHVPEGCERPCDINEMNNSDSRCLSIAVQNVTAA
jgi:hypothetical protein